MSMTEESNPPPAPSKQRKARKPQRRKVAAAAEPKVSSDFDGISPQDCPSSCKADRCIISGVGICAHPFKGGLQAPLQNPGTIRRFNEAKRILGKRKLDLV